ncbi:XRE family transcriptional regulator [Virgisporangium ochraceum]|uniref:XRE family transcriptional regulator n=1 Tax=Virgisporangium ochraceum TaxID=65505 RepID=UPI00194061D7|nr:XRE family transcriptional regulator [Virgisporangium ochraceum]
MALRLRALRESRWPDLRVTQFHLAEAFGGEKPLSLSLISSWESTRSAALPPVHRLNQYSIFFATRRSVSGARARLLTEGELTPAERVERDVLYEELSRLRYPEDGSEPAVVRRPLAAPGDEIGGGPFHFVDQKPVTIVCSRLPAELRAELPYTDPRDPDYIRSFSYADNDALIELYGHVRAVNPTIAVNIRTADVLEEDDYTTHLVLLGGTDWNPVTADIQRRSNMPVLPGTRTSEDLYGGHFTVVDGADKGRIFAPILDETTPGERPILVEDVAHFFRGQNPYNRARTLTLCDGMFARGTYAAVRTLTDVRFRDRNERFLWDRFNGFEQFSVLARAVITPKGEVVTPDWTVEENRLHVWPLMDDEV